MNFCRVLYVGCGSLIGGMLRYVISCGTSKWFGTFPLGTLIVNILGGFLMGAIMEASNSLSLSVEMRIFLTTGIMGGLTTFSTFSFETISYFSQGKYIMGAINAALNLVFTLLACFLGKCVATMILN